jgi:hypothetical protein
MSHGLPAHPDKLIERLDEHYGQNASDPYWARIEALMLAELAHQNDSDHAADATLLRQTTSGLLLETAARHVGFIEGVEYCKQLLRAGGVQ